MIDIQKLKQAVDDNQAAGWPAMQIPVCHARELIARLEAAESNQVLSASARQFKQMEERVATYIEEKVEMRSDLEVQDALIKKQGLQIILLEERLEAAEQDAAKWHEYQAKKKVLADRGFGKSPLRDAAMKETK